MIPRALTLFVVLGLTGPASNSFAQTGRELHGEWVVEDIEWHRERSRSAFPFASITITNDQFTFDSGERGVMACDYEFVGYHDDLFRFDVSLFILQEQERYQAIGKFEDEKLLLIIPWLAGNAKRLTEFTMTPESPYVLFRLSKRNDCFANSSRDIRKLDGSGAGAEGSSGMQNQSVRAIRKRL